MAWHRADAHPVVCGNCRQEIEHCAAECGWMHSGTRSELCAGSGRLARPETPDEFDNRRRPKVRA